jgi:hypothetical protein
VELAVEHVRKELIAQCLRHMVSALADRDAQSCLDQTI